MTTCKSCRYFLDDSEVLERWFTGLTILSSAYGDTWGDQGVCLVHERLLTPTSSCSRYEPGRTDGGESSSS